MPVSDSMALVYAGIAMIFIALILLIVCVSFLSKVAKQTGASKSAPSAVSSIPSALRTAPSVEDGVGDEIVAVIAAAIAAFSAEDGKTYAVQSIKRIKSGRPIWAFAGLQENTHPF